MRSFFDVYLNLKRYEDILEIGELLLERYDKNNKVREITLRNMIHCCVHTDRLDEGVELADTLMEIADGSDLAHYTLYKLNDALGNHEEDLRQIEICISIDPKDIDYYFIMASAIIDDKFARDPDSGEIIKIDSIHTDEYAVPFILAALNIDPHCISRAVDFLRRNNFTAYINDVIDVYQSGSNNYIGAFDSLNFGAVEHCLSLNYQAKN